MSQCKLTMMIINNDDDDRVNVDNKYKHVNDLYEEQIQYERATQQPEVKQA